MKRAIQNIEAIFLDRDGTIGGDSSIHYPGNFTMFPFSQSVIQKLKKDKIKVLSFTNQPGIADGMATRDDFIQELLGFGFDDVFVCPHAHHEGCSCRKPKVGMLLEAAQKYELLLENCVVIGDRLADIIAARKVNCKAILVKTGAGKRRYKISKQRM